MGELISIKRREAMPQCPIMRNTKVFELVPARQEVPEDEEKVIWIAGNEDQLSWFIETFKFQGSYRVTSLKPGEPGVDIWLVSTDVAV